jgi:hypothetical protein
LKNIAILRRYKACPPEDELVSDFMMNIHDPRLDSAIDFISHEGSLELQDFDKAQKYFTNALTHKALREKHQRSRRSISSVGSFRGKVQNKYYPFKVWKNMSKAQKEKALQLRAQAKSNTAGDGGGKRKASSVEFTTPAASSSTAPPNAANQAGHQFGSAAHSNSTKRSKY